MLAVIKSVVKKLFTTDDKIWILPIDITVVIFSYLTPEQIIQLLNLCTTFKKATQRCLENKSYCNMHEILYNVDWKITYQYLKNEKCCLIGPVMNVERVEYSISGDMSLYLLPNELSRDEKPSQKIFSPIIFWESFIICDNNENKFFKHSMKYYFIELLYSNAINIKKLIRFLPNGKYELFSLYGTIGELFNWKEFENHLSCQSSSDIFIIKKEDLFKNKSAKQKSIKYEIEGEKISIKEFYDNKSEFYMKIFGEYYIANYYIDNSKSASSIRSINGEFKFVSELFGIQRFIISKEYFIIINDSTLYCFDKLTWREKKELFISDAKIIPISSFKKVKLLEIPISSFKKVKLLDTERVKYCENIGILGFYNDYSSNKSNLHIFGMNNGNFFIRSAPISYHIDYKIENNMVYGFGKNNATIYKFN
jgi:hypothetical protein